MRRCVAAVLCGGSIFLVCGQAAAQRGAGDASGSQQADRHSSQMPAFADSGRAYSRSDLHVPAHSPVVTVRQSVRVRPIIVAPIAGYYFGGPVWPYPNYYDYPYVLSTDSGVLGPYTAPPLVVSGESQFGPQAVQRFMGVNPVPRPAEPVVPQRRTVDVGPSSAPPSDSKARVKAWKSIDAGDADFILKRFQQALSHYRQAATAARDLAAAQFRQAFALLAMGKYSDAVKSIERGLQLDPDWPDSDFRLDEIYGDNKPLKQLHLDALKNAVAAQPHDAEALFLLGVFLYFDGQSAASTRFFHRAENVLGPVDGDPLSGFIKNLPPDNPPAAGAPPAAKGVPGNNPPADKGAPPERRPDKIPPPPLPDVDKPAEPKRAGPVEKRERPDPFEGLEIPR